MFTASSDHLANIVIQRFNPRFHVEQHYRMSGFLTGIDTSRAGSYGPEKPKHVNCWVAVELTHNFVLISGYIMITLLFMLVQDSIKDQTVTDQTHNSTVASLIYMFYLPLHIYL